MAKIKPEAKKLLSAIAKQLPHVNYSILEKRKVTGSDLLLANQKEVEGKEIEPEKTYYMTIPAYYPVNHERRLKEAFKREGSAGISKYCKPHLKEEGHKGFDQFLNKYKKILA